MILLPENSQRAKNITVAFYIFGLIQLISIYSTVLQINLLHRIQNFNFTMDEARANDQRQTLIVVINLIAFIICAVLFIMWFRRAYNNLNLSRRTTTYFEEAWASGGWFVPFLNLGRPYSIMKEIWDKTQDATSNLLNRKGSAIVGWWWAMWLVSNVTANIASFMGKGADSSIDAMVDASWMSVAGDAFQIVALILVVAMIKQTSVFEKNLADSLANDDEENTEHKEGQDYLNFIT